MYPLNLSARPITLLKKHHSHNFQAHRRCHFLNLTVSCKLKTNKRGKNTDGVILGPAIGGAAAVVTGGDVPLKGEKKSMGGGGGGGSGGGRGGFGLLKRLSKRLLSVLSNLPLAIAEMFAVAALMALGNVLDFAKILISFLAYGVENGYMI